MKRKKLLSILASLCMIFTMMFTMNLNVEAAITGTTNVTINGLKSGTTVNIYKAVDVKTNSQGNPASPALYWNDSVKSWVETEFNEYIGDNGEVTDKFSKDVQSDSVAANKFWQSMETKQLSNTPLFTQPTDTKTATGTSVSFEFGSKDVGSYLVSIINGDDDDSIYYTMAINVLPTFDEKSNNYLLPNDFPLDAKSENIPFKKELENIDYATIGVGKNVPYIIDTVIPKKFQEVSKDTEVYFKISDTLSKGLSFNNDVNVYLDNMDGTPVDSNNYKLTTTTSGDAQGFSINFNLDFLKANQGKTLFVTYSATVTKDAVDVTAGGLVNDAKLQYWNNKKIVEKADKEKVYTYGIKFNKKDENGSKNLTGAVFTLSSDGSSTPLKFTKIENNKYVYDENGNVTDLAVENASLLQILGLDTGTYVLTETKAPDGYVKPEGSIKITLKDSTGNKPDGVLDTDSGITENNATYPVTNDGVDSSNKLIFKFDLKNNNAESLNLPVTGGTGTMMYTLGGLALMGGAAYLFISNKKKQAK